MARVSSANVVKLNVTTTSPGLVKRDMVINKDNNKIVFSVHFVRCSRGAMVKVLDSRIVVSEFELLVALLRSLSGKYSWESYGAPLSSHHCCSSRMMTLDIK